MQNHLFSSVQFIRSIVSDSLRPHESQQARPPCLSPNPGVHSDSRPSSQWCHPAISSSVGPFSCPQSLPASESFPMSQHFTSGVQSIGASASIHPVNIQGWFPLGLTGLISLLYKGLLRVFSSTTVWKHQFFGAQPSFFLNFILFLNFTILYWFWYNSYTHIWLLSIWWKDRWEFKSRF